MNRPNEPFATKRDALVVNRPDEPFTNGPDEGARS